MDNIGKIANNLNVSSRLSRFIPEPRNRLLSTLTGNLSGLASNIFKSVGSATSLTSAVAIDPDYTALLNRQIEIQQKMQIANMDSNLEKSKHETLMAPIRNIKVQ
jgi:hypothetical protein